MTSQKKKQEEVKEENLEFHSDIHDYHVLYLGTKVDFEMKGLNHYTFDAKKIIPVLKTYKGTVRKPNMKLELLIQQNAEEDDKKFLRQYILTNGKTVVMKLEFDKEKDCSKALKQIFRAAVEYITNKVKDSVKHRNSKISEELSLLNKAGKLEGIFHDIPDPAYHQCEGVSKSQLSLMADQSYAHLLESQKSHESTPAMELGSAFHTKVLTPKSFDKDVAIAPDTPKRSDKEKADHGKFEMENAYKYTISANDADNLDSMTKKLLDHPYAYDIIKEGEKEVAMFWKNHMNTLSRGKVDGIINKPSKSLQATLKKYIPDYNGESIIYDVKTDRDPSPETFMKTIANRKYHWQAAKYIDGATEIFKHGNWIFIFIVVENHGPNEVAVYPLCESAVEIGRERYQKALEQYEMHRQNEGMWHGYSLKPGKISVPGWEFNK